MLMGWRTAGNLDQSLSFLNQNAFMNEEVKCNTVYVEVDMDTEGSASFGTPYNKY